MRKRNQVNITLEDDLAKNASEYCRVHGITVQELFKIGAQRLIEEDILERQADVMTLSSLRELGDGAVEPIDDLLEMIAEDKRAGDELSGALLQKKRA